MNTFNASVGLCASRGLQLWKIQDHEYRPSTGSGYDYAGLFQALYPRECRFCRYTLLVKETKISFTDIKFQRPDQKPAFLPQPYFPLHNNHNSPFEPLCY